MIQINLLGGTPAKPARFSTIDLGQKVTVACSAILVIAVIAIGWRFWSLRQDASQLTQELVEADAEIERLDPILERVREADAQRVQLAQRVVLIEQLRQGQTAPVRMLDAISRAMPDGLWLVSLAQEAAVVTIDGRALTLTALSDFVASLELSEIFMSPVEIVESQIEETDGGDVVNFQILATFAAGS